MAALPKTLLASLRRVGADKMAPACLFEGPDIIRTPALLT